VQWGLSHQRIMGLGRPAAWPTGVQIIALAVVYFVVAEAGLSVAALTGNVTPVWPPTGVALAALVLFGRRLWPGVALGALLVNGLSDVPMDAACGMAVGNTLEALTGASLLHMVPGFRPALNRVRDVIAVVVLTAGVSTAVSASVGVASLALAGVTAPGDVWTTWHVWWAGDALGALVVLPLILTWARGGPFHPSAYRLLAQLGLVIGVTGTTLVAFSGPVQRPYLVFPLLICAATVERQRGATTAILLVSCVAVGLTVQHIGPFVTGATISNLQALDTFLAVVAVTTLMLAAMVSERDNAEREAHDLAARLELVAGTDVLTGLGNLRTFHVELERQVAEVARFGPAGGLLVLDLDRLKEVNDTLGHDAGDKLVSSVTEVLRRRLRQTDVFCRIGGDEFAIILPRAAQPEAEYVAATMVNAVREHDCLLPNGERRRITISVGIAMFDTAGVTGADMLVRADLAMYRAKQTGRDRSAVHRARVGSRAQIWDAGVAGSRHRGGNGQLRSDA
jgi:diguanylate cyclase (GGDEF)-like protein